MAYSIYLSIFTFNFLFYLDVLTELFGIINILSKQLQSIELDYKHVKELSESVIDKLKSFIVGEKFERIWIKITNLAIKLEIDLPEDPRIRKKPKYLALNNDLN